MVIAIDGPSGTGKSSTAKAVARRLGYSYLDTGAMYRATAILHQRLGLGADAQATVAALAEHSMDIALDPDDFSISLGGEDLTEAIRTPELSAYVSTVATMVPVREYLAQLQRHVIAQSTWGIVVEGRDITTVVAPDADVRVLLVADPQVRLQRRREQLGAPVSDAELTDQVLRRDRDDSTVSQFEAPADGVHLIDSTHLSLDEVVEEICSLVPEHPQE